MGLLDLIGHQFRLERQLAATLARSGDRHEVGGGAPRIDDLVVIPSSSDRKWRAGSRMMRQAVAWGLIPASPVPGTRGPKVERPDLDIPDVAAARALTAAAVPSQWDMPMFLAAYTGARRGEVIRAVATIRGNHCRIVMLRSGCGLELTSALAAERVDNFADKPSMVRVGVQVLTA